ncbi:serine/threonine-protein kinase [Nocardia sp. NPDC052001]|uniref:serine/threonine-protein kinase n=1 Tax=Nocardia sp. NPDC052001 TaxID=3154853 RepID=UPI00341B6E89
MVELRPGSVFGDYRIERVLGGGGMGTVYAARHPRLPRVDALKVLSAEHGDDVEFRARFAREADLTARLNHPNIVAVHDRGVAEGRLWIAMQLIDGTDAAALLRRGALEPERALRIVKQAASGLDEAHRAGVVHRDVKPANLLVESRPGQPDRVLVTDFGIGRGAGGTVLTETGTVLATLAYAAPEQLAAAAIDARTDVYALGCTLYELLTGAKPFPRPSAVAVMHAHLMDPPPRPTALNPALPQAIDDVIARALAKRPEHRYRSCGALAAAAAAALGMDEPVVRRYGGSAGGGQDRTAITSPWWGIRGRRGLAVGAVLSVAVLGAVVALAISSDRVSGGGTAALATTGATSGVADTVSLWGGYSYIAQAFPALLPSAPESAGYQSIHCAALDSDSRPADIGVPATGSNLLSCSGNKNPVYLLTVRCNADRSAMDAPELDSKATGVGDQAWRRGSASGQVRWGDMPSPAGDPAGTVAVSFDDAAHRFCRLVAYGGTSGQDLLDRWWRDAPI